MPESQHISKIKLPHLPFGEAGSVVQSDLDALHNEMSIVIPSLKNYETMDREGLFAYKSTSVNLNGMKIIATANTPAAVEVTDNTDITLIIPFHGNFVTRVGRRHYQWQAKHSALFLPCVERCGQDIEVGSHLTFDLSADRLQSVARSILGASFEKNVDLQLHAERMPTLNTHHISFDEVFRHLCEVVDSLLDQPEALEFSSIDDVFYRNIVLMLQPDLFLTAHSVSSFKHSRREVDEVCEYIQDNLEGKLTLSEIERVSGMSDRKLQYAFFERFGCSPMHWVRDQRLNLVHHRLKNAHEGETVTSIASSCGFTNLGAFSALYQEHFKELPSATLKHALK